MKLHLEAQPLSRLLLSLALGIGTVSAGAGPVSYYQEFVTLDGAQVPGASVAHSNATVYALFNQVVEVSSAPAPFIQANSQVDSVSRGSHFADGTLLYDIGISGPANTLIPVVFDGQYAMGGQDLAGNTPGFSGFNDTRVSMFVGFGTGFDYQCKDFSCVVTTRGSSSVSETLVGVDAEAGNVHGALGVLTDASGNATLRVQMGAYAHSLFGGSDGSAMAWMDPEFHIDAAWLALNPGATLSLPPGVGNAIAVGSSVPEPASYVLMLSGLGLMGFLGRRKQKNTVV